MTSNETFKGNFTQQEPISEQAIAAAVAVLRSGRLHRYNVEPGELGQTALLERDFARLLGVSYCLAVASGGQSMQIALRAAGVAPGDPVLTNAFTLAPVPGAINAVGGRPMLVEIDEDLHIDMEDLEQKAKLSGAQVLLLSHMRGHLCDMDRLMEVADACGLIVIEDCAHTMGARWKGRPSGSIGLAGCFSTQTYKHINSGEGGFLTSDDPDFMARAIILSGSYMLYERHGAAPDRAHFANPRYDMANNSARMDELRAAILRPQLETIEENARRWNARYDAVALELSKSNEIVVPRRLPGQTMVGSSIQFRLPGQDFDGCRAIIARAAERGVELKWFGAPEPAGFTSSHRHWRYAAKQSLPRTDRVLDTLFDMRLPLTFSIDDCRLIGRIIREVTLQTRG